MAIPNENPINVINYKVNFTTTNLKNGDTFIEPHTASGPVPIGSFNIALNASTISGNKVLVPLQTTTAPGSYWLKFWLPQPNSSVMYVTFAQKNLSMADGYYDFKTGVPDEFRNALTTWIIDNVGYNITQTRTFNKTVKFTVYGLQSNQVSSGTEFRINFKYLYQLATVNPDVTSQLSTKTI